MQNYISEPVASAATIGTINASKIGVVGGAVVATSANAFGEYGVVIIGWAITIGFGILGLWVTLHFKKKEHAFKAKEDSRRDEEHKAAMAERAAMIARLTSK